MNSIFGDDFKDRADLQRRQIYHQQLLDTHRFSTDLPARDERRAGGGEFIHPRPHREREGARETGRVRAGTEGEGFLSRVLLFLALVFFVYTIPAALTSAAVALVYSVIAALLARHPFADTFRMVFRTTFIALTCVAAIAIMTLIAFALLH